MSRYRDLDGRLIAVLELLVNDHLLPPRNRDHALSGNWSGYRDCHLWPDLLLIYAKPLPDVLQLVRLGPHADLFDQHQRTGALVGFSGAILSYIMCRGMNRSIFENELFYRNNTMMLFGDAKKMCEEIVKALE